MARKKGKSGRPRHTDADPVVAIDGPALLERLPKICRPMSTREVARALRRRGVRQNHSALHRLFRGETASVRKSVLAALEALIDGDRAG